MAVSNYKLAAMYASLAPKTFRQLQDLVIAMEKYYNNEGKT